MIDFITNINIQRYLVDRVKVKVKSKWCKSLIPQSAFNTSNTVSLNHLKLAA